jgi:hypothetical protein
VNKKTWGIVLIVLGVLMVVFDFLAIPLHLASVGFGPKQIALLVAGIIVLVVGLVLSFVKGKNQKSAK